jgi:hypothetical protein
MESDMAQDYHLVRNDIWMQADIEFRDFYFADREALVVFVLSQI